VRRAYLGGVPAFEEISHSGVLVDVVGQVQERSITYGGIPPLALRVSWIRTG